jgi:DNA replication protein DnaC
MSVKDIAAMPSAMGRGKTVLAYTLLFRAARRCKSIALAKSDTLNDSRMDRTLQRYLCCANTLLIDDIEKGVYSEPGVAAIHAVLDRRHDARLRTIVTSERTPAQVHETFIALSGTQYGTSTLSRLAVGRLKPLVLELTGKNLRKNTD